MRTLTKAILLLSLLSAVGIGTQTSAQTFTGSIANGTVARGRSARGTIVMSIPAGLHVNSNRPSSQYAIATTVKLTGAGVGAVSYPRGRNKKFQFSESLINVYEGRVAFGFTVKVPTSYRGRSVRVRATVRYQACTDEVCYPPKTRDITMTARVQ
ncbi:MAG TPA: protein-disulfide reductase DsbD domain-containing protein [Pyrinomonadaceae bacterium]|nr:protein-disulfide reductase DsbD domain-containing protein [Pyrinomonadaceae bacterium]